MIQSIVSALSCHIHIGLIQRADLIKTAIEMVTGSGHSECRCGGGGADGGLRIIAREKFEDEPGGKSVAAADAIQNSDVLKRRSDENIAV